MHLGCTYGHADDVQVIKVIDGFYYDFRFYRSRHAHWPIIPSHPVRTASKKTGFIVSLKRHKFPPCHPDFGKYSLGITLVKLSHRIVISRENTPYKVKIGTFSSYTSLSFPRTIWDLKIDAVFLISLRRKQGSNVATSFGIFTSSSHLSELRVYERQVTLLLRACRAM
jgi:hypothetical protein